MWQKLEEIITITPLAQNREVLGKNLETISIVEFAAVLNKLFLCHIFNPLSIRLGIDFRV